MNAEKLELANKLAADIKKLEEQIQRLNRTIEKSHPDDARNARLHFTHLNEYANQDEPILPAHKFKALFEKERAALQSAAIQNTTKILPYPSPAFRLSASLSASYRPTLRFQYTGWTQKARNERDFRR